MLNFKERWFYPGSLELSFLEPWDKPKKKKGKQQAVNLHPQNLTSNEINLEL